MPVWPGSYPVRDGMLSRPDGMTHRAGTKGPQKIEGINAVRVGVTPIKLQGVAANEIDLLGEDPRGEFLLLYIYLPGDFIDTLGALTFRTQQPIGKN